MMRLPNNTSKILLNLCRGTRSSNKERDWLLRLRDLHLCSTRRSRTSLICCHPLCSTRTAHSLPNGSKMCLTMASRLHVRKSKKCIKNVMNLFLDSVASQLKDCRRFAKFVTPQPIKLKSPTLPRSKSSNFWCIAMISVQHCSKVS